MTTNSKHNKLVAPNLLKNPRSDAEFAIFRYIESYYNPVRPHSSVNWLSPNNFEKLL